jgi:O-Antigen ligase
MIDTEHVVVAPTARGVRRQRSSRARITTLVVILTALGLALFASSRSPQPAIALLILMGAIVASAIRPICGLYAVVFFTMAGDAVTTPWYPFAKNLSAGESLLYLSDKLFVSPLDVLIGATFAIWLIGVIFDPYTRLVAGPLAIAVSAFTAFVAFGFVHGVASGGDPRIALFEGRAMFFILPVYLMTINLCDRGELRRLVWTAVAGVVVNGMFALKYLSDLTLLEKEELEDLGEHSASVHFNFVLLLVLTLFLYRGATRITRFVLLGVSLPLLVAYLAAERRSAVVALAIGVILVVSSLWWRHRSKFYVLAPVLVIVTVGYAGAFWNSTSSVGFPAQAIKAVVQPDEVSEKDRSSSLYRDVENFNINYTIRSSPVLGLGFGQRFLRPVPLADISFFEFYEYIPHNSILWIWIKTGFLGFVSMLTMFAIAVRDGARHVVGSRDPTTAALAMIGVVNVVMFAVYAFVDIAWDARNMVFVAVGLALCSMHLVRPEPLRRLT